MHAERSLCTIGWRPFLRWLLHVREFGLGHSCEAELAPVLSQALVHEVRFNFCNLRRCVLPHDSHITICEAFVFCGEDNLLHVDLRFAIFVRNRRGRVEISPVVQLLRGQGECA